MLLRLSRVFLASFVLGAVCAPSASSAVCDRAGVWALDPPQLTADGSAVVFATNAALAAEDTNRTLDVYIRKVATGAVELVSAGSDRRSGSPSVSADGRFVAFESDGTSLTPDDDDVGVTDVFVRDRAAGTTDLVSVTPAGSSGAQASSKPSISPNGMHVAFQSAAPNLVDGDTNDLPDIFVRDGAAGTTTRVSIGPNGQDVDNLGAFAPSMSGVGRVAFHSTASWVPIGEDLRSQLKDGIAYDRNIFVHDLGTQTTTHVSVSRDGGPHDGLSMFPSISSDGRHVAFSSSATNLVEGDTNNRADAKGLYQPDVFVRDLTAGTTRRVSVAGDGTQADGLGSSGSAISGDGAVVAFESAATNLDAGDVNGSLDVFVHRAGATSRASAAAGGGDPGAAGPLSFGSVAPSLSADGKWVAFVSSAPGLVGAGASTGTPHLFGLFVRSLADGTLTGPLGVGCRTAGVTAVASATKVPAGIGWIAVALLAVPLAGGRRTKRLAALSLVLAALLPAIPAHAHHHSPIQPGAPLDKEETTFGPSSLNFVFRDRATGELYIGTAGHSVRSMSVGSRVANDAAGEYGMLVYSREGLLEFSNQDFALIKIDAEKYPLVDPAVRHWGGPTAVARAGEILPLLPTYQYGQGAGFRHTEPSRAKVGVVGRYVDDAWGYVGWIAEIRGGFGGDSGSPILYGPNGEALGVTILFAAVIFGEPAVQLQPSVDLILQELNLAGFDVELVTAPFHGPAGDAVGMAEHCAANPVYDGPSNEGCVRPRAGL